MYAFFLSVTPSSVIMSQPIKFLPKYISMDNYKNVFRSIPIVKFIFNSILVAFCIIMMQIFTSSLAAYAFVFFEFKFKKLLFFSVLATIMIPSEAIIISNYLTISSLKLLDSYAGLTLPYFASAMGIFIMRQNYMTMPKELKEAATMDGCSEIKFFIHILFPISIPAVCTLAVYTFINVWNQYMWPMLVTNSDKMRTVQIGISMLKFADGLSLGVLTAALVIILIPSIVVFTLGQELLVGGMTAGSVKG